MHHYALNQAITLYRGEALTLEQASHHAGVSSARMETALRSHNVPIRSFDPPTADEATAAERTGRIASIENPPTGAD